MDIDWETVISEAVAWEYFEKIAGVFAPERPDDLTHPGRAAWVPMWAAVAQSFGAGPAGAVLAAEAAWAKYNAEPVTQTCAAEIVGFLERTVRA